jgi:hypothetical protein
VSDGRRDKGRSTRNAAALAVVLPLLGCVAEGTDFEGYPFVAIDNTKPGATHVTVPIALSSYDEGGQKRIVRGPGGGHIDTTLPEETQTNKLQLLWPIATWTWEGREHEFRLFAALASDTGTFTNTKPAGRALGPADVAATPVIRPTSAFPNAVTKGGWWAFPPILGYDRAHLDPKLAGVTDAGDDIKRDFGLFPLFMGGDWPESGFWMAVAPFGGVTRGFLGKDEMDWYGFPYPIYLYARERNVESRHILFPLINWIHGGGREGFRIFPFYAHYRRTDLLGRQAYDRHWIMWPLFSWATNSGGQGYDNEEGTFIPTPTEESFFFPFYGDIEGPDTQNFTFLWPFFRYEEHPSTGFWELRAPFPVFIMHHGLEPALTPHGAPAERWRFDIWPLFGYRSRPYYVRHFIGWPIERFERRDDQWVDDTKFYFLPLVSWHHHHEKESKEDYQRTRIWPFLLYRRGVKDDVELHILEPILWDDPGGFERVVLPFFRLYEYKRTTNGGTQHRFLLGLASWRDEPAEEGVTGGLSRLSLLFGLVQVRSGGTTEAESRRAGVRLFYLPEISWERGQP